MQRDPREIWGDENVQFLDCGDVGYTGADDHQKVSQPKRIVCVNFNSIKLMKSKTQSI